MIYLNPQIKSGVGEDTFWTWFNREFESSYDIPQTIKDDDVVLQYSVMGPSKVTGGKIVSLQWELFEEMSKQGIPGDYSHWIDIARQSYNSANHVTVSSSLQKEFYPKAIELPIGIDTDIFYPRNRKKMREKWNIDQTQIVGFWGGNMQFYYLKGLDKLQTYQSQHPEIQWITVFKEEQRPQAELAELMSCCDFVLFTGRLRPYFMVEWEAMACDLPVVDISGLERDFMPGGRRKIFELKWSRCQTKEVWYHYLKNVLHSEVNFR